MKTTGGKGSSFTSTFWLNQLLADSCKSMCMDFYRKSSQTETTFLKEDERKKRHFYEIGEQISEENYSEKANFNSGREFWKLLNSCNSRQMSMMNQINEEPIDFDNRSSSSRASPQQQQQQQSISDEDARQYDLVIFAASGTVGRFLVEEMALVIDKYYSSNSSNSSQHANVATSTLNLKELRDPLQFAQQSTSSYLTGNNIGTAGVRRVSVPRYVDGINWAIAGRSAIRLSDTLCRAEISTGVRDLSTQVPVILADLDHHRSLLEMCSKTSVVISCAGPYTVDGEALIRACLETRTNYIDLSHESSYIERIRVNYHTMALRNKVFIMNGCGFQSMSAEMGLNFIKQVVDGQIDEVKIMLNLNDTKALIRPARDGGRRMQANDRSHCGIISSGMWNSFLIEMTQSQDNSKKANHILGTTSSSSSGSGSNDHNNSSNNNNKETANEQKDKQRYLLRKDTQTLVRDLVEYKNKKASGWLQLMKGFNEGGRRYCLPVNNFMSDETQLTRGEMTNYEIREPDSSGDGWRPVICTSYLSLRNLCEVLAVFFWMLLFNILVQFPFFGTLLRLVPSIVTFGQVTASSSSKYVDRDSLSHIKFCQTLIAYGTPGDNSGDPLETRERHVKRKQEQLLVARVVGPEPNHVATATFAIQAALAVILEKDHLPSGGGVLTPGVAFSETNIIHQLRRRNIKFEVLKKA